MTTQPEALRLALALEVHTKEVEQSNGRLVFVLLTPEEALRAAAELRRLHAQIAACKPYLKDGETPAKRMYRDHRDSLALMTLLAREKTKNEALLEALKEIAADYADRFDLDCPSTNPGIKLTIKQARAAIAKTEGQQ